MKNPVVWDMTSCRLICTHSSVSETSPAFMFRAVQEYVMTWNHPRLYYHINMGPTDNGYGSVGTPEGHDDLTDALFTDRHNGHTDRLVRRLFQMATCSSDTPTVSLNHATRRVTWNTGVIHSSWHRWKRGHWHPPLFTWRSYSHVFHVTPLGLPSGRTCICYHMRTDTRKCQLLRHTCGALTRSFMTFVTGNETSVRVLRSPT